MSLDEGIQELPSAQAIVHSTGMSGRPEFYSGRGVRTGDLNGTKLKRIYAQITHYYGADAGEQFVRMIADVPVLSATDFLLSLYRLEASDQKWSKTCLGEEKGSYAGHPAEAFATIVSVLSRMGERDDTLEIRAGFWNELSPEEKNKHEWLHKQLLDEGRRMMHGYDDCYFK